MENDTMAKTKKKSLKSILMNKELLFGVPLVVMYGLLLFWADPAWVAWAGPMVMGALVVPEAPPAVFSHPPVEVIGAATFVLLPAMVALALLMLFWGEKGSARPSVAPARRLLAHVIAFLTLP